jgi:hypothetical protein
MRYLFFALVAAVVLVGCSGGNNDETTVFDFAGEWQGSWENGTGTANMTLAPVGDHLEGQFTTAAACTGQWPVVGHVIGGNLQVAIQAITGVLTFTQLGADQITSTIPFMIPPCGPQGQLIMSRIVPDTLDVPPDGVILFYDERGKLIGEGRRRAR